MLTFRAVNRHFNMDRAYWVGRSIALGAAIFYGFNTTLSKLAYDTGTTPVTVTFVRFALSALLLAAILLLLGKSWRIRVAPAVFAACVLGMVMTSIGHLGAVKFIPVSLSAIIFYTFPLLVIAWKRVAQRAPVTRRELTAFVLAFAGIGIALGPEFHTLDPVGIALAACGACGATLFILSYERFPPDTDAYAGTLWIMIASVALSLFALPFGFDLVPPAQPIGWFHLTAVSLTSVVAFVLSLQAIPRIGGGMFALFMNFEPVVIFMLAWLVLAESMTPERLAGIGLILFALMLSHWRLLRPRPEVTEAP